MLERFPAPQIRAQATDILLAWGLDPAHAQVVADRFEFADLRGIDSHGIALLPLYARLRAEKRINMRASIRVIRDAGAMALVDADHGLGHPAGTRAMQLAIEKARANGIGAAGVRNSNHFGAAGAYAALAAEAGLVGLAFSSAWDAAIVPTWGAEPRFGTNPLAIVAPSADDAPFFFDIATSTVAIGKLRLAQLHGRALEPGWALDMAGEVTTDPAVGLASRRLTPLGATPKLSSHKGYGLAASVEVLATMLTGAAFCSTREHGEAHFNVGHFFIAIDPAAFRPPGEFERDLAAMQRTLRRTAPAEVGRPVVAPGDPEAAALAERASGGIPVPDSLLRQLREIAGDAGARWRLGGQ